MDIKASMLLSPTDAVNAIHNCSTTQGGSTREKIETTQAVRLPNGYVYAVSLGLRRARKGRGQ